MSSERRQRKRTNRAKGLFARRSVLAVLDAASVSPTAAHRQALVAAAVAFTHTQKVEGAITAGADHLDEILAKAPARPNSGMQDDFEPLDVRLGVGVRWGDEVFLVAPGGYERPIAIIEDARLQATALDAILDVRLGFRLHDLIELALRHMDASLRRLRPHWPAGELSDDPVGVRAVFVNENEVAAARPGLDIAATAARCSDPERAARALRWASCEPRQLTMATDGQSAMFGPVLAVRRGEEFEALPTGYLLDGVYEATGALHLEAMNDPDAARALDEAARLRVLYLLSGSGARLIQNADAGRGPILALAEVMDGLCLAVDVAVDAVDRDCVQHAEERLRAFVPGMAFHTSRGQGELAGDERVVRLVVVVSTASVMFFGTGDEMPVHTMTTEDLRWVLGQSKRPEDLAAFLLDLESSEAERTFSFGTFDEWEVWRGNGGAFHRLGAPLSALIFEPHHERAEWQWHAELRWLEYGLARLGVRGVTFWPRIAADKHGAQGASLTDYALGEALEVAVVADDTTVGLRYEIRSHGKVTAASIARTIVHKLRSIGNLAAVLELPAAPSILRIVVADGAAPEREALRVSRNAAAYLVEFHDGLGDFLIADTPAAERQIAELFAGAAGLSPKDRDDFVAAWTDAPPGIAVDVTALPQRATRLRSYLPPHNSILAAAERQTAITLRKTGVLPGLRTGMDARDLESKQINPLLRKLFTEAVTPFDPTAVIMATLENLERAHLTHWREEGHLGRLTALSPTRADLTALTEQGRRENNLATRSLALTVEETLRVPASGRRRPRELDLQRIYAIAHLLYESGMRSESIHQRVIDAQLEITGSYELLDHTTDHGFDRDAFRTAVTHQAGPRRHTPPIDNQGPLVSITELVPEIASVDTAMRTELGFGIDALLWTLDAATSWPVTDDEPVATVTPASIVADVLQTTPCPRPELEAVVEWLSLKSTDLQGDILEHWELDRRPYRLASRPFVRLHDGSLAVCPWGASVTRTIVINHLSDGRLPWPGSALPKRVNDALATHRQACNTALEREVVAALDARKHLRVKGSVKKAKVLGLTQLPRELDGVCLDEERRRIWIIETKDRTVALSPHQLRTALDEFHRAGGFVDKVIANVALIEESASLVATALGAAEPNRDWQVIGLIATRRIEPAAFAGDGRVAFTTADTVAETIDRDHLLTHPYQAAVPQP